MDIPANGQLGEAHPGLFVEIQRLRNLPNGQTRNGLPSHHLARNLGVVALCFLKGGGVHPVGRVEIGFRF